MVTRFLILVSLSVLSVSEFIKFSPCPGYSEVLPDGTYKPTNCSITKIEVIPCPEAKKDMPCRFRRGVDGSVRFTFVPKFSTNALKSHAYWVSTGVLPLPGMNSDACVYSTCPIQPNQENLYIFNMSVPPTVPRTYDVKWVIWDGNDADNHLCCAFFPIRLS